MKNKKMITFFAVIILLSLSLVLTSQLTASKDINDIIRINYQDTFNQEDQQYIVYFWQESCKYCIEVETDVTNFASNNKIPIYLVDMQDITNQPAWYDWELHHQQYDLIIGKEINGEPVLNDEVDLATFENDDQIYWTFETNTNHEIVAVHNTPYGTTKPYHADGIEITGTPTMIKVMNGAFEQYATGVDEVRSLLANP